MADADPWVSMLVSTSRAKSDGEKRDGTLDLLSLPSSSVIGVLPERFIISSLLV